MSQELTSKTSRQHVLQSTDSKSEEKVDYDWTEMIALLDDVCCKVSERYDLHSGGQPRKAMITEIVSRNACIACIDKQLRTKNSQRIDSMYGELHQLGCNLLVEELYCRLVKSGHKVNVTTEADLKFGKADIFIVPCHYGLSLYTNRKEIVVEVKSGFGLSIPQLLRYLIDKNPRALVLWRIRNEQTVVLEKSKISARAQYLPYHFWLEETNQEDKNLSNQSESFGDWLHSNFVNIRSNFPNIVYKILPAIIDMHTTDKCLLILVIDNFNYKFADVLTSLLQNHGFRLVQKAPYFSMIPSDTETSKRCLIAGQPKASEILLDYDSLISSEWRQCFPDRQFFYLKSTVELENAKASIGDVLFVNCIQIDDVLHQDERKLGKRHSVAVEAELQNLTNLVTGFFNQNGLTNSALIVVCSDHGSTMIPTNVHNEIDPAFFVGKSLDAHHRFLTVSQEEYDKLPSNIKFQCYYLDAASFGLPENVLIAKGYYRFKKTNEHFFVHGGLSPEETIIPFIALEGGEIAFKKPTIRLLQNEFRYLTKTSVEIEIVNENSISIEDIRTSIAQEERKDIEVIEPAPVIEKIDAASLSKSKIICRFYKSFDASGGLKIAIEFKFLGKSYTETKTFAVQMKSLMETSFKLGELP